NRCASQRRGPDRGSATRSLLGSWAGEYVRHISLVMVSSCVDPSHPSSKLPVEEAPLIAYLCGGVPDAIPSCERKPFRCVRTKRSASECPKDQEWKDDENQRGAKGVNANNQPKTTMKIGVDDWHFKYSENDTLLLDVFLDNGQHAMLEVNGMKNPQVPNGEIPEMIVFCELPGEKLAEGTCPCRWISRPPGREFSWSNVQVPLALMQQIKDRMGLLQPH